MHVIAGEDDRVCLPAAGEYLAKRLTASLSVIPDGDPAAFLTALDPFRIALDAALDGARTRPTK